MKWSRAVDLAAAPGGGLLLAFATPPAILPGCEWLVLPGLGALYALATTARRPWLAGYLFGVAHVAWFSWSLRHVLFPAYAGIALVGGLYTALAAAATRAAVRILRPAVFAVAVAATWWLRSAMPEIPYPHGQPCHALWQWPALLGAVVVGGEALCNALLAALAAALVEAWRSWRTASPEWRLVRNGLLCTAAVAVAVAVAGRWLGAARPAAGEPLRVVAIEPGLYPFALLRSSPAARGALHRRWLASRLVEPTLQQLADEPPDLVLWPESSLPEVATPAQLARGAVVVLPRQFPAVPTRLVVGAHTELDGGVVSSAWLVELPSGRVIGHQDKRCLVPGGEFLPLLGLLPPALAARLRDWFASALGSVPDGVPGSFRPPLETAAGTLFGALSCYDNAFPGPAADQVAAGARLLVVLSNEAWYRGGGELAQLAAMTVFRALETGAPVVRCTQDGWTMVVGADGRMLADLPLVAEPPPAARILRCAVAPGQGILPPLAWLRRSAGPAAALLLGAALAHALWTWARLRIARTAPRNAVRAGLAGSRVRGS